MNAQSDEKTIVANSNSWEKQLYQALLEQFGQSHGEKLNERYINAFDASYKNDVAPIDVVNDLKKLENLSDTNKLEASFSHTKTDSTHLNFKIYNLHELIEISSIIPILENMGMRTIKETTYPIDLSTGQSYWILNLQLRLKDPLIPLAATIEDLQVAFKGIWLEHYNNDEFNYLITQIGMSAPQVVIFRAYAGYIRQVKPWVTQTKIAQTLINQSTLTKLLLTLFYSRFDPTTANPQNSKDIELITDQISQFLEKINDPDEDQIVRYYKDVISATIRTSFFQNHLILGSDHRISFKISSKMMPGLPLPLPQFEAFVYAPHMEGIHLRKGKIARGGIRWSDRFEDFRVEVLSLMKVQQIKNSGIVPAGAKGGFVCKRLLNNKQIERHDILAEVQKCYQTFIRGLLDITDNIIDQKIISPKMVVCHDEHDPYFVVAADRGTASFSDIANNIAHEYNFWLRDAFASGGSCGYDHKKIGITARGAWEGVKRHFREIGIDCQKTDFTCVGIGGMSGDVFGNGLLQSKHIRLIAAFNTQHIFFDPNPEPEKSYQERQRLFNIPGSRWSDYSSTLISSGGGVFNRAAKYITLSPEMRSMLDTDETSLTPDNLIKLILQLPVDLFWNGGVGTYVKAEQETDKEVQDHANDSLRITSDQLRAKIVGEGGNLGLTQRGRIEYAMLGGHINADFIDNVGGVDCSDNEVNIKILLNNLIDAGELTLEQRNQLLVSMTNEVAAIVLNNANQQCRIISIMEKYNISSISNLSTFIEQLEQNGQLNRTLECLPSSEELKQRQARLHGLTRPELAMLVVYAKMVLKEVICKEYIFDNALCTQELMRNFPMVLQKRFARYIEQHPLRKEIIATRIANRMVNQMGPDFRLRMQEETGASLTEIINAYIVSCQLYEQESLLEQIEDLNEQSSPNTQALLFTECQQLIYRATHWFIKHQKHYSTKNDMLSLFNSTVLSLGEQIVNCLTERESQIFSEQVKQYQNDGVPLQLAQRIAKHRYLYYCLDIAEIASAANKPAILVAQLYFSLIDHLYLPWLLELITGYQAQTEWQRLSCATLQEALYKLQRQLVSQALRAQYDDDSGSRAEYFLQKWLANNKQLLKRWYILINRIKQEKTTELEQLVIAVGELYTFTY